MKPILFIIALLITGFTFSQDISNVESIKPEKEYENILVKKLYSDAKSTFFVIWIKQEVKSHKHATHTESIVVLEGKGKMTINKKTFKLKAGDYFVIPENTFHSLKVTSKTPMKVISVQAPEFLGKDRVFESDTK